MELDPRRGSAAQNDANPTKCSPIKHQIAAAIASLPVLAPVNQKISPVGFPRVSQTHWDLVLDHNTKSVPLVLTGNRGPSPNARSASRQFLQTSKSAFQIPQDRLGDHD